MPAACCFLFPAQFCLLGKVYMGKLCTCWHHANCFSAVTGLQKQLLAITQSVCFQEQAMEARRTALHAAISVSYAF